MAASVADRPMAKMLHNGKGYKISLFLNKNKALQYQCSFCNQICCDAVELFCSKCNETEYKNDNVQEDEKFYCEICLTEWLSSNNTKCPINQNHFGAVYNASHYIRKRINQLITLCPKSEQNDVEEGAHVMMTRNINTGCNWKGKLFQLLPHVENACKFAKQEHCKYHQFGCEYVGNNTALKDHDEKCVVYHIDLMQRKFAQLNQEKDTLQKHVSKQNIKIQNIEQQNMERINVLEQNNIKLNNITIAERKKLSNQMDALKTESAKSRNELLQQVSQQNQSMKEMSIGIKNQIPEYVKKIQITDHPRPIKVEWYHPMKAKSDKGKHRSEKKYRQHPGHFERNNSESYYVSSKWTCCRQTNEGADGCKQYYVCCRKIVSSEKDGCYEFYPCCNVQTKTVSDCYYNEYDQGKNWYKNPSIGCKQRYQCCKQDFPDSKGCETKAQLEMYYHLKEQITYHSTKPLIHKSKERAASHPQEWKYSESDHWESSNGYYPCCSSRERDSESCVMKCCMQKYSDGCLNRHKSNQTEKYHPGKWNKYWPCCGSSNREYKGCKTRYKCCKRPEKYACIKLGYYECCNVLDSFVEQKRLKFEFYQETEQKNEENDSYETEQKNEDAYFGMIHPMFMTRPVHHMKAKAKVDAHGNTDVWLLSSGCNKKYACCGKEYPSQGCQKIIIT